MVKLKSAISIAAVCLGSSTVPVTVIIVVKYRLIYQLVSNRWTSYKGCQSTSSKQANRDFLYQAWKILIG